MPRPSDEELQLALSEATRMREQDEDQHHVAKTLLNLNYRMEVMEELLSRAKHYLHSGHGSTEHVLLIKAIEKADQADAYLGKNEKGFGF